MKLKRILIKHFLGINSIDVKIDKSVVLFHANNAQGKTCVLQGIRSSLTGKIDGILKKDLPMLLHNAESKGYSALETGYSFDDHDGKFSLKIPSGNGMHLSAQEFPYLKYCINTESITKLRHDEFKKTLFDLMQINFSPVKIIESLKSIGVADAVIARLNLSNFDSAIEQCNTDLVAARASWKAITGEVYGSDKAENFEFEEIKVDDSGLLAMKNNLNIEKSSLEGLIKESGNSVPLYSGNIHELREKASKIDDARKDFHNKTKNHESSIETLAYSKVQFENARFNSEKVLRCTKCAEPHKIGKNGNLEPYNEVKNNPIDVSASKNSLDVAEKTHARTKIEFESSKKIFDGCESAKLKLDEIESSVQRDPQASIDLENKITLKRQEIHNLENSIHYISEQKGRAENNAEIKKRADQYHGAAKSLVKIIEVLKKSKDDQLADSINPINERLASHAAIISPEWIIPVLDEELNVTAYNGRPWVLLSESDQWKISIMLSECISFFSNTKLLLIDRVDILATPDRGLFFKWLIALAKRGDVDTVVCAATLAKIEKAPPAMDIFWIENGEIK